MKIRWKLHCRVVATRAPTQVLEVEEMGELKNLLKWGKFYFYASRSRNFHISEKYEIAHFRS